MIKGRGLLANALSNIDRDDCFFYANGISNSVLFQIPDNNFEIKEIENLAEQNENKIFIYFSTSQVNLEKNHHRAYVRHKLIIEQLIVRRFPNYLIIRTSNLVGINPWNKHTLFNYLFESLHCNNKIIVDFEAIRNFLDVEYFVILIEAYLSHFKINNTIEIVNPDSYSMRQVIDGFESFYSRKFNLQKSKMENNFALFEIDAQLSLRLMKICKMTFNDQILVLLRKYYS